MLHMVLQVHDAFLTLKIRIDFNARFHSLFEAYFFISILVCLPLVCAQEVNFISGAQLCEGHRCVVTMVTKTTGSSLNIPVAPCLFLMSFNDLYQTLLSFTED